MPQGKSNVVPMQSPGVTPLDMWPIVPDAPDIRAIVEDQAATIMAQETLLHAYQTNLNSAQAGTPGTAATGNGTTTGSSTSLVVTGVGGIIQTGATVSGSGIPTVNPPTVLGQISGATGSNGTYLLSAAVNLASATALTFTPKPSTSTWPSASDSDTLLSIQQIQTAVLRVQSALLQHYVDLLNTSAVPQPPTGP
jgi:hypothetical protein